MKKDYYKYLKITFTVLILILLARYIFSVRDQLSFFKDISWGYLLLVSSLMFMTLIVNAIFLKSIVRVFSIRIPWFNSLEVTFISSLFNSLTPFRGGAGVRAVYLKEKEGLDYKDFVTVMIGNYLIVFLIGSIFGLIATLTFYNDPDVPSFILYSLLLVFGGLILFILIFILVDFTKVTDYIARSDNKVIRWIGNFLTRIDDGWIKIVNNRSVFWSLILLTSLNYILLLGIFYFEFLSVGLKVDLRGLVLYTSLSAISLLISITPGSLGIREAFIVFGKDLIGLTPAQLVSVSLYDRTLMLAVIILSYVGIYIVKWIRKRSRLNP